MYCRICGSEERTEYRERSRMTLCPTCHEDTPEKATYAEFLAQTGMPNDRIAKEFFSDYKASTHGNVSDYWQSCSAD